MAEPTVDELRYNVATAMRMLGSFDLVREITGHVSARIPGTNEMLVRCRGGNERGLIYTDVAQVRRMPFDIKGGQTDDEGYMIPIEVAIHGEMYKTHPETMSVVHAHPRASVMCGILGLELRPIFGAFDPGGLALAARGVPVYPRSVLISRPELGQDLAKAMGGKSVVLMKGHGITSIAGSVEAATIQAIKLDSLAAMILEIAHLGREAPSISHEDLEAFGMVGERPERPRGNIPRGEEWVWKHYVQLLRDGVGLPE
jgi:ribulose-5-phosphate 4-epimerase/fuculose-1-phosphate aldolase